MRVGVAVIADLRNSADCPHNDGQLIRLSAGLSLSFGLPVKFELRPISAGP